MADIPVWPGTLPSPSPDGYAITPVTAFSRTDMDNGTARQRRRFTRTPSYLSVSWTFSQEQLAVFEGFVAYELGLGANWFQVRMLSGTGMNQVQARLMDDPPYKATLQGGSKDIFQVSATLEIKALPIATRDQYEVIRQYTQSDIDLMSDPLHEFVHVDLPGPSRWN